MPDYSAHYNLIMLQAGESLSEDDYAFTGRNISNLDAKAYLGAEAHHHNGAAVPVEDPDTPPSVVVSSGSGAIPGNRTIRYKYTWVDEFGQETAPSPEVSVTTPAQVAAPNAPILSKRSGGSLLFGNYFYVLTAWADSNSLETTVGDRAYTTLNFSQAYQTIRVTFPSLPANADGFNIYRRSPGSSRFQFLASVNMSVATPPTYYDDDGSVTEDCNRSTPNRNTTGSNNSVEISLPGATPAAPDGFTWKIYRTYTSGDWDSSLLHWVVEETTVGSGIITPTYTDTGASTSAGRYPVQSELSASPSKIQMTDVEEVQGYLPTGRLIVPMSITFVQSGATTVQQGSYLWPCDFDEAQIMSVRASLGPTYTPASDPVIIDIEKYDSHAATPSWSSIFNDPGSLPTVPVGETIGNIVTLVTADTQILLEGDALRANVLQSGGGATPTDYNLVITVKLYVKDGNENVTQMGLASWVLAVTPTR
jgi:hypothetical protein